ncbi:MAG: 12-oxophytodienoate reductase, partial [Pseudomonadota bacterium]|nr:12-oxophytodienoate reductase [Pseudomonadota bacterium]
LRRGASEAGWRQVVSQVHEAGGYIFAQLFHVGAHEMDNEHVDRSTPLVGPSGLTGTGRRLGDPPTDRQVGEMVEAFATAAALAKEIGFDGIELHAGHGYLIDQFLWEVTNLRTDQWGGTDLPDRTRFASETVAACRAATSPRFPISFRFSQWKIVDYDARLAATPDRLERMLAPLVDVGVDIFHCSTRRYWTPEFPGSDLNLAGWTKKLTGLPTIAVGSVTLATDLYQSPEHAEAARIDRLVEMLDRGDFDLFAVGRALIANPDWPLIVARGAFDELRPFDKASSRAALY